MICAMLPLKLGAKQPTEYEVKAAFLLNFAKFVEWPPKAFREAGAPLVIGILGENPFGETLSQLAEGETAQGRPIEIRQIKGPDESNNCHILFLSRSVAGQTDDILQRLQGLPVLTVSEKDNFVRRGGVIGFALVDKTVRFDINAKVAETIQLKISSKLLAVARSVVNTS